MKQDSPKKSIPPTVMKYSVNRCNRPLGEDMESKFFPTKAEAIKWGRKCFFARVRDIKTRELVFSKG